MKFEDEILKVFAEVSRDVIAEMGADDALSKKIYASYQSFRGLIGGWTDVADRA